MHAGTGKGEIFAYADGTWLPVELPVGGGHLSYAQIVEHAGATYVLPAMVDTGPPTLFELDETGLKFVAEHRLQGLDGARLVDGTMGEHEGCW
ncbi:hypothetical protein GCM10009720_18530 [Yaniella flava]|uniref:Transposase n=2 Tax=Yaniella flava TaxID=287930 RepID=A0ABN2UKD0_9MICC